MMSFGCEIRSAPQLSAAKAPPQACCKADADSAGTTESRPCAAASRSQFGFAPGDNTDTLPPGDRAAPAPDRGGRGDHPREGTHDATDRGVESEGRGRQDDDDR